MKEVIYLAHPVSGDVRANVDKAVRWIAWLTKVDPTRVYVAPWVAEVLAFIDDGDVTPEFYDRVLGDDETVISKLNGIILTGIGQSGPYVRDNGFMKSVGMTRELAASVLSGGKVFDLRHYATAEEADGALFNWDGLSGTDFINVNRVLVERP